MIIYLVKSTLLLGLLFGVYKLLLENEKMHRFNRFFLLFALIFGLTAPLISFGVSPEQSIAGIKMQQMGRIVNAPAEAVSKSVEPLITPEQKALPKADTEITPVTADESGWSIGLLDILFGIYGLTTLFLLIRFAGGLMEIRNKVKAGSHQKTKHATLVLLDEPITPQSFFGYIFLEKKQFESGEIEPEILDHEITHVRQLHSLDVLFTEFLKVIFWFNPLMYLYKDAIQLNHEFLADDMVVSNGSSVSDYQNMLIRVCAGSKPMKTTSSISYSLTKRRLLMIGKRFSALRSGLKHLFLFPLLGLMALMFCARADDTNGFSAYPDIDLTVSQTEIQSDVLGGTVLRYKAPDSSYFTGTQNYYNKKTDQKVSSFIFENGFKTASISYNENGEETLEHSFEYAGSTNSMVAMRMFNDDGEQVEEWLAPGYDGNTLGSIKEWHPNGSLKFEVKWKEDLKYQGIMTLYDEEGIILEQERYQDGELIEKIK